MILLVLPPIPVFTCAYLRQEDNCRVLIIDVYSWWWNGCSKWKSGIKFVKKKFLSFPENLIDVCCKASIRNYSFRLYKISLWSKYSTVRLTIEIFLEIRRHACTWWVYTSRGSSVTWNTGLWILVRYYARYVSEPPVALDFGTINGIHVRWIHTSMARRFASNVNELIYVDVSYIVVQVGRLEFRNPSSESQKKREKSLFLFS